MTVGVEIWDTCWLIASVSIFTISHYEGLIVIYLHISLVLVFLQSSIMYFQGTWYNFMAQLSNYVDCSSYKNAVSLKYGFKKLIS